MKGCLSRARMGMQFVVVWFVMMTLSFLFGQVLDQADPVSPEDYAQTLKEEAGSDIPYRTLRAMARSLSRIDRLRLTPTQIVTHVKLAQTNAGNLSPEDFERYLLPLRIRSEFSVLWSPALAEWLGERKRPEEILERVREKVKLEPIVRSYPLGLKGDLDPLLTLRLEKADEISMTILAIASLRSQGIPCRMVYTHIFRGEDGGKVWLEYRQGNDWIAWVASIPGITKASLIQAFEGKWTLILADPLSPENITREYLPVAQFHAAALPVETEEFEEALHVMARGALKSIVGRDIYHRSPQGLEQGIAPGIYYYAGGSREFGVGLKKVMLTEKAPVWLTLDVRRGVFQMATGVMRPEFFPQSFTASPECP